MATIAAVALYNVKIEKGTWLSLCDVMEEPRKMDNQTKERITQQKEPTNNNILFFSAVELRFFLYPVKKKKRRESTPKLSRRVRQQQAIKYGSSLLSIYKFWGIRNMGADKEITSRM